MHVNIRTRPGNSYLTYVKMHTDIFIEILLWYTIHIRNSKDRIVGIWNQNILCIVPVVQMWSCVIHFCYLFKTHLHPEHEE